MAAALAAGCGSDDDEAGVGRAAGGHAGPAVAEPRYAYPSAAADRFVAACVETSGGGRAVCRCTIDHLRHTLPYERFAAADRALREGRPLDPAVRRAFDRAAGACRDSE